MRTDNFNQKKKKFKPDSRFFARILVIIISAAMLIGTLYYALAFFSVHPHAEGTDEDSETNFNVRIQIFAGENITCSVRLTSDSGFELGYTDAGRSYYNLDETSVTELCVSRHVNLKKDGTKYDKASSTSDTAVGCYHINIASDENYREDVALLSQAFPEYNVFPAYINGEFRVFIGQFSTTDAAASALSAVKDKADPPAETDGTSSLLPEDLTQAVLNASVHTPGGSSVIAVDPSNDKIVWAHDSDTGARLFGIGARQNKNGEKAFFKCYHGTIGKTYDGYFEFAGNSSEENFGVRVINLVKLETYIVGVCSAEIPTTWPMETIKAFSIAVRCYTIRSLGNHRTSSTADLCNTAHCQVFNGYGPAEDRVWRAVAETKGIIAVSNGSICGMYYSSSTGGCTANCTDVWGSSLATYPYLKAVATPWEQYRIHNRGQRTTVVTGMDLYNTIKKNRNDNDLVTTLTGPVTDVKITKTGQNTTYVTEIKFYDAAGNCETYTRADRIKKLLGDYVYSSNFVVVKSGETAVRTNYTLMGFGGINPDETTGLDILGNPYKYSVFGHKQFNVITSSGTKTFYDSSAEKVMTAGGLKDFNMSYALDSQVYPTIIGVNGDVLPDITKLSGIAETESIPTEYAENSFTFIGRGWGHGVGLSQYGIYDLGNLGYDYLTILKAYYTGIEYMTYKDYLGK